MPIEVRHSPDVRLTGNVAFLTGQGKARREDQQQAREAADRRAAQERAIQAQFEQMNLQAELQAARDQDSAERATAMDERNFQQQKEILKQQGLMRANEAEAAHDRDLERIDYTYTAKERAHNDRLDERIQYVKNSPIYTQVEKDDLIGQMERQKLAPTGLPEDFAKEVRSRFHIETLPNDEQILFVNGQNGIEWRPLKAKEQKDTAAQIRFNTQKARANHIAKLQALTDGRGKPMYTREEAKAAAEELFPMPDDPGTQQAPAARTSLGDAGEIAPGALPPEVPVGLKASELQDEYSAYLREAHKAADERGADPAAADAEAESHKARLIDTIQKSLLLEIRRYGQLKNAPPAERKRLEQLRSLLDLWKEVQTRTPISAVKPQSPPPDIEAEQ